MTKQNQITALRGPALSFTGDPFLMGAHQVLRYESDALIVIEGGRISGFGPYDVDAHRLAARRPRNPVRCRFADSARLRRYARALSADPDDRRLREATHRLVEHVRLRRRTAVRRPRSRTRGGPRVPEGAPSGRNDNGRGVLHGVSPVRRRLLRGIRAAQHAHDRRQGAHGPQRPRRAPRHRQAGLR